MLRYRLPKGTVTEAGQELQPCQSELRQSEAGWLPLPLVLACMTRHCNMF